VAAVRSTTFAGQTWAALLAGVAALLTIMIALLWWLNATSLIGTLTDRSGKGKFFIGLWLAIGSPLLAVVAIGLPIAAVFYWLIMYYSLAPG
jgi:hypothetical protein